MKTEGLNKASLPINASVADRMRGIKFKRRMRAIGSVPKIVNATSLKVDPFMAFHDALIVFKTVELSPQATAENIRRMRAPKRRMAAMPRIIPSHTPQGNDGMKI